MEREQFTFFASFAKAAKRIKNKSSRCDYYDAIINYALYEEVPDLEKISEAAAMGFELIKPNLDSSRRKAESGRRGGEAEANRKGEENASKSQAKRKQTAREIEVEKEIEIEKENENEIEYESIDFNSPSSLPDDARVITTATGEKITVDELHDRVRRIMRPEVPV